MNRALRLNTAIRLIVLLVIAAFASIPVAAQSTYVLTSTYVLATSPSNLDAVVARHGLTVVKELYEGNSGKVCVMLVSSPAVDAAALLTEVQTDVLVTSFEPNQSAALPELSGLTQATLQQSTSAILETLHGRTVVSYYGSLVPSNYSDQAATEVIRLPDARSLTGISGSGIVAIIDTGVDTEHLALVNVLVPGYNFIANSLDPSELQDLSPATAAALAQSTSAILEDENVVPLSPSTVAILNQSTSAILEGGGIPQEFGHGTMVAGIVHLIAPTARIMPLKAFRADGTSDLASIVTAIYYAVDHGANVINMSFSVAQSSPALHAAILFAREQHVTVVASSGNDGLKTFVYPASFDGVQGVGSCTAGDLRSAFSNYGSDVTLFAAPGEGVITTYPSGLYAAGWGTSFSAPIMAGAAALVLQAHPGSKPGDITDALSRGSKRIRDMRIGRIDLCLALTSLIGGACPAVPGSVPETDP
jgi:subtilisin family serine protease